MVQISFPKYVYLPRYSVKCIFCFIHRHFKAVGNLRFLNSKIWTPQNENKVWSKIRNIFPSLESALF